MWTLLESAAFHFFSDVFQMRLILPYIAPFLRSLLWFCFKPFVAHGAKPPTWPLQLSSSTVLQGESLHLLQRHAKWRFSRSQEFRNAPKCSYLKLTEGIPEPTQHSRALLLSVQCIFSTCSVALSYFSSAFLDWETSLTWKGAVRDRSNATHSTPLCAAGSWKGKLLEVESSSLAFCPPTHIWQSGKQILHRGHWFVSYHAVVRQPWTEVEAHKSAKAIRSP